MNIQFKNSRINLDALNGIQDHLKALAIANKTLDSIKKSIEEADDKTTDWYRRVTVAHKSWFWMRSRICEKLSVLRREEKEMNKLRARYEDEELLKLLKSQAEKSELKPLIILARSLANARLNDELKATENQ